MNRKDAKTQRTDNNKLIYVFAETLFPRCVKCTKTEKFIGKGASSLVAWL
jgi:hypothetical protein